MVILITGATSGFGRAMAERLCADGHIVYGTHRHGADFLPGVNYIVADSTVQADVEAAVSRVVECEGRINVLVNNAGMGIAGPLEYTDPEDCRRQMDVNFMGMVRYVRAVLPQMRSQGSGRIICMSSIGGLVGLPYQGVYSASKFAVEGYCDALRLEVGRFGVSVTVLEPGDFATAFTARRKAVPIEVAGQVYKTYGRSLASIEHDERTGLAPEVLARRVSRIVSCRRPPRRTMVASPLQKLAVVARIVLPGRLFDWIMRVYYKM